MTNEPNYLELNEHETDVMTEAMEILFYMARAGNTDAFKICGQLRSLINKGKANSAEKKTMYFKKES